MKRRGWFIWFGEPREDVDLRGMWMYACSSDNGLPSYAIHMGLTAVVFICGAFTALAIAVTR